MQGELFGAPRDAASMARCQGRRDAAEHFLVVISKCMCSRVIRQVSRLAAAWSESVSCMHGLVCMAGS
jgi:hypothetical protein